MKIFISHIMQRHDSQSTLLGSEAFEQVALSQFKVAQAIIERPGAKVISESLSRNYTEADIDKCFSKEAYKAKELFPQGLQCDYSGLTNEQKSFLVAQGGDLCAFFLGYLREIYKSIDEKLGTGVFTLFGNNFQQNMEYVCALRECAALEKCKEIAEYSDQDSVDILLVYGAGHDFKNLIQELSHPDYIFKQQIETIKMPDLSRIRLEQLIKMLNKTLGSKLAEEYGDRWFSTAMNHTNIIKGYINAPQEVIENVFQQINEKLSNSNFRNNYVLTKEILDVQLNEWSIKLFINDADNLLAKFIVERLRLSWKDQDKISLDCRKAIRQKTFQDYVADKALDYETVVAIHKDENLRNNLTPMDYVWLVKKQPSYFDGLIKNQSILIKIIKNKDALNELVFVNSSIAVKIIKDEECKEAFLDNAKRKVVLNLCVKYQEFAEGVILDDVMTWNHKLKENDFIDIAKAHPMLADALLDAKDFCDEYFIAEEANREILNQLKNNRCDIGNNNRSI